jgi:hypothetical protein
VTAPADTDPALETPDASGDLVDALGDLDDIDRDKRASITSDRTGKSFDYTYADLAAVLGHVRPILARHRLAVVQPVETTDQGFVAVSTVLVHTSGQRFPSPALRLRQPDDARTLGSTITYLRRYSVLAALGLATEDLTDDELRGVLDALREGVQVPTPTEQFVDPADVDGRVAEWRVEWSERLEVAEGANDLAAITTLGNEAVAQHDQVLAEHARNAYDRVRHGVL